MLRGGRSVYTRVRLGLLAAVFAGGSVVALGCNSRDIQHNIVAGSLGYVKNSATSFWNAFIPTDDIFQGLFDPAPIN